MDFFLSAGDLGAFAPYANVGAVGALIWYLVSSQKRQDKADDRQDSRFREMVAVFKSAVDKQDARATKLEDAIALMVKHIDESFNRVERQMAALTGRSGDTMSFGSNGPT